jgi:hypothetical protein
MQRPDDVEALKNAIKNGQATEIMDMVREMDAVVHALGLEDDFAKPSDRIKRLLRADLED